MWERLQRTSHHRWASPELSGCGVLFLAENGDQKFCPFHLDKLKVQVTGHHLYHFFRQKMNPHMRREFLLLIEPEAHRLEYAEMMDKIVKRDDCQPTAAQHPLHLFEVRIHLKRGKVNKHVVRKDDVRGRI